MAGNQGALFVSSSQCMPDVIPKPCVAVDFLPEDSLLGVSGRGYVLNIPDLMQAPQRPPTGWCGEAAIQMALLYRGAYLPQEYINRAGSPAHPDLYSNDIPHALDHLGVTQNWWPEQTRDVDQFVEWVSTQTRLGYPVLMGMKVNPSKHPEWSLDHFVLVPGLDENTMTINTTWGYQTTRTLTQLKSTDPGLGLSNSFDEYYGVSIGDMRTTFDPMGSVSRLMPIWESADELGVVVKCDNLVVGAAYAYIRADALGDVGEQVCQFTARGPEFGIEAAIQKDALALYRCVELNDSME